MSEEKYRYHTDINTILRSKKYMECRKQLDKSLSGLENWINSIEEYVSKNVLPTLNDVCTDVSTRITEGHKYLHPKELIKDIPLKREDARKIWSIDVSNLTNLYNTETLLHRFCEKADEIVDLNKSYFYCSSQMISAQFKFFREEMESLKSVKADLDMLNADPIDKMYVKFSV